MNEFSKKWNAMSKKARRHVRQGMQMKAAEMLSTQMKLNSTTAQMRAAAKVSIAIAKVAA